MSHYFVAGAAGFIGAKVVEFLLQEGHQVTGVDNLNDAYDPRLKEWRLAQLTEQPGFHFWRLDLAQKDKIRDIFVGHRFDAVINLAARAGVRQSVENPWVYIETNVTGTLNLLDLCREFGVRKFVLASTSSLYGEAVRPFSESLPTDMPLSPYAASKKGAEVLAYVYHYLYGLDVTVLRYFTVYGPAGRPDMSIFRFVQRIAEGWPIVIYGDGRQERDFTYVDDIARGTLAALRPLGYEVINLGSDRPIILLDAVHMIETRLNRKAQIEYRPRHAADVPATWADITKAKRLLQWQPRVPFEECIAHTVDWYLQNREWVMTVETQA